MISMDHTLSLPRSRDAGVFSGYGFHYQVGSNVVRHSYSTYSLRSNCYIIIIR